MTPHAQQRRYHNTHSDLRASVQRLERITFYESMAVFLAASDIDLNHGDRVLFGLIDHGFSPREINACIDLALPRAFEIRRDNHTEIGAVPGANAPVDRPAASLTPIDCWPASPWEAA